MSDFLGLIPDGVYLVIGGRVLALAWVVVLLGGGVALAAALAAAVSVGRSSGAAAARAAALAEGYRQGHWDGWHQLHR